MLKTCCHSDDEASFSSVEKTFNYVSECCKTLLMEPMFCFQEKNERQKKEREERNIKKIAKRLGKTAEGKR